MKKFAFTLIEVLIAMSVIGIITAATANSIKNITTNKTKHTFQNCYNHIIQTVADITNKEELYPVVEDVYSRVDETGRTKRYSMCDLDVDFPLAFKDSSKAIKTTAITNGYTFETAGGIYWVVRKQLSTCQLNNYNNSVNADYIIMFDIDGPYEGTNCPYNVLNPSNAPSNCAKPDTFAFGVSADNKVVVDNRATVYNGKYLNDFMIDNKYLQTNKGT